MTSYAFPPGGLPDQDVSPEGRAVFTTAYAVLPAATMRDIVTSLLPGWTGTRAWILARPLTGFAETFAQYAIELAPGGGSDTPEPDPDAQAVLFAAQGQPRLTIGDETHDLSPGSYAYIPARTRWTLRNPTDAPCGLHWIRKRFVPAEGLEPPAAFVTHDSEVQAVAMPGTNGVWATQRFADPADLRFDFHVNIVSFEPGGRIPFAETHVMEHGLYVLQGEADYLLNDTWVPVGPGDFMWLRAFCPQACIAKGSEPFRYLLYKDVNRHPELVL
ncbi:allantoin catabolism protein [Roseivivax halodurans JCM 10272]|uniref:Allantoin catabolism protein n=1 Tax=Roseivivax halodurans JCM 10272 TaxID=1449350 RepID=X7ED92_9RHOB|nr:bifunctional allantoicase/(S)-ureidoglycine aminohydrolase [Roseivivax halodurans]ETX13845.1 allantoin catabolism protein [Roseivivax halodurans JCM 10272]